MRITVVGVNYAPEVTGIAPYTTGFAEGMARAGHEVQVITAPPHYPEWRVAQGYEGKPKPPNRINGVTVERVKVHLPTVPSPRGRVLFEASFARSVIRSQWSEPDLVVAVSPTLLSTAATVAKAKLMRIPCGVIVQDLYSRGVVETGALSGRLARAAARFEGATLNAATGVSVIHDRFVESVAGLGVDSSAVTVVRNWTHIAVDLENVPRGDIRAAFGWKDDEIIALHTGNMGVKQALENVVAAARLAADDGCLNRVRFVLVGDGNQRKFLEKEAEGVSRIDILDPLPGGRFRSALNAADVLLVNEKPGVGEMAVPSKLTSYFISGKPVVAATDSSSGCAHEIELSGGGCLVPAGDAAALLSAVVRIGSDKETAEFMGAKGRKFALQNLGVHAAMDQYDAWCQALVAKRS